VIVTVEDLIEELERLPLGTRVVVGCMPGQEWIEIGPYSAELDCVRIVGSCDGDPP
jgi:hypothetical protein